MSKTITLYRYLSAESAIKTIELRAFRVSRLVELNDPFEWRPGFEGVEKLPAGGVEIAEQCLDRFLQDLNETRGIICYSTDYSDPVLWSHYADLQRGLAFEVNRSDDETLFKVDYDKPRPVVPVDWLHDLIRTGGHAKEIEDRFFDLFKQKSKGWSYEKEYRVVVGLDLCPIHDGMYFQPIPDNYVKRVIIGARSTVSPNYVRRALEMSGLSNVQVVKARRSIKTYEIEIE